MADKANKATPEVKDTPEVKAVPEVQPLAPRIHINEFFALFAKDLNNMQKAGFKAIAKGKEWMRKEEWLEHLEKYLGKKEDK